ncbi:MAG: ABC transporter ATP-binding protein [Pseudomonadota bacterium]
MSRIAAQSIRVRRAGRTILDDVSVSAGAGEFVAVIGPNGAGKSTLLSVLAGLLKPDQGSVSLDHRQLADCTPRELARVRAFLPQNPRCEWPLPVHRLVGLGLTPMLPAFGDFSAADVARIDNAVDACDLTAQRDQPVTTLSGGELARAMLARALVADPAMLIVDEPLTGLDPRHAQDAARRLQQLAQVQGKLVIASIHDLNIALRRATCIWALREGRILAVGAPAEVIRPQLLRELFDVEACVCGSGAQAFVDFAP